MDKVLPWSFVSKQFAQKYRSKIENLHRSKKNGD